MVNLLDALPWEEREYYCEESNVLDPGAAPASLLAELTQKFGFVGGSEQEYAGYFARDLPAGMWEFSEEHEVRAIAGFSVVNKKARASDGKVLQRKLLIMCPANFVWGDARSRSSLGMHGGAALASCLVKGQGVAMASFDQSNAFTSVRVPRWMSHWQCCPPLRAEQLWHRLPEATRARVTKYTWIYPRYMRLAMGGSHSVHLLMSVNLHRVGVVLWNQRQLRAKFAAEDGGARRG